MALKTASTGAFNIPTSPAVGTTVTGGAANTFTTNAVQLIASTGAAIFIMGLHVQLSSTSKPTYVAIRLSTGAGDGSIVGEYVVPYAYTAAASGTQMMGYIQLPVPIAVATATRIGCKSADSVGSLAHTVILSCINQANVVEAAIDTTSNVTQWNGTNVSAPATAGVPDINVLNWNNTVVATPATAGVPDINVKNINNVAAATPGAAGGLFIAGTNAPVTITGSGDALTLTSTGGNGNALNASANGTGAGFKLTGGATGHGASLFGGATSGNGLNSTVLADGHGIYAQAQGISKNGIYAIGGGGGASHGMMCKDTTGGGIDFVGNITGNLVGTLSTLTTYTGNTPQTGDVYALANGTSGFVATKADTAAIKVQSDKLTFTVSQKLDCNVYTWNGTAVSTPGTVGVPDINVLNWNNTVVATPATAGVPDINVKNWKGTVVPAPNTGGVPVVDNRLVARVGTAQATGNSTTAIKLDASASATTDFYKYHRITVVSGTGAPQSALCTAYDGSTKIATVSPAWPTAPDNTSVFVITADAQTDLETVVGTPQTARDLGGQLDAAISTRLAAASYTAPDNATIALIYGVVDIEVASILAKVNLIPGTQDGKTYAETILLIASALLGKVSGMDTNAPVFRGIDDSKDRISATTDSTGNRSAVTLDAS